MRHKLPKKIVIILIDIVEQFDPAAELAPKILEQDATAWEKWIDIFVQHQQLPVSIFAVIHTRLY